MVVACVIPARVLVSLSVPQVPCVQSLSCSIRLELEVFQLSIVDAAYLVIYSRAIREHLVVSIAHAEHVLVLIGTRLVRIHTTGKIDMFTGANARLGIRLAADTDASVRSLCHLKDRFIVLLMAHAALRLKALPAV